MIERANTWRCILVSSGMGVALAALGVRLGMLHLAPTEGVREQLIGRRQIEREIQVARGTIRDSSAGGKILALDLGVQDVCADPQALTLSNLVPQVAAQLAGALSLDARELTVRLSQADRQFAYVSRFVPESTAGRLRDLKLPGVFFQDASIRYYPQHEFMCHVLGFANVEGIGSAGVEQTCDRFLRGSPGIVETEVDGLRKDRYLRRTLQVEPKNGAHVILTLDQNVQYMVEQALDGVMTQHHAHAAFAIVERVRTGEILAMASRPGYDLNAFRTADDSRKINRSIGAVYEPGSTLKVVAISAALNERIVSPNTVFDCENGMWMHSGKPLRDSHPYGRLSVADILKKSSNIGTAKIATQLGRERLYRYQRAYGLGAPLGLDLPGEESGILHPVSQWAAISVSRTAIGQGVAVTALQLLGLYGAIANDGRLMKPFVVRSVQKEDGTELYRARPTVLAQPIRADTARTMRWLLSRVTEEGGTGTRASIDGLQVAGKTGTAQKPERGGYSSTDYMASFVGFFPADDPQIGMIVVVDTPQPMHTGGVVAAPAFRAVAEQVARYLDVFPEEDETDAVQVVSRRN